MQEKVISKKVLVRNEYFDLTVNRGYTSEEAKTFLSKKYNITHSTVGRYTRKLDTDRVSVATLVHSEKDRLTESFYKSKYTQLLRRVAGTEEFIAAITREIIPIPFTPKASFSSSSTKEEMLITFMLSDAHFGRTVNSREMEGYSEYNFEIGISRLWHCLQDIVDTTKLFRNSYKINMLDIDILGDMINDESRNENKWSNQWPNALTTVMGASVLAQAIVLISSEFPVIRVNCVVGNESRMTQEQMAKLQYQNFDFLLYHMTKAYLKEYIKQGKIIFNIPYSPEVVVEKLGWEALLLHGHSVKSWNSIPAYGLLRMESCQQEMRKARGGIDFLECAHFHEGNELKNEKIFVNGALAGADEYSRNGLHRFGPPSQRLLFVTEKEGIAYSRVIKNMEMARTHPFVYGNDDLVLNAL